jgi:predicted enzyme related to lactoylglutathione lyase
MAGPSPSFAGVELYFDDLETAKRFYTGVLGLEVAEEQSGLFAKFDSGSGFICLERKGAESYPSYDKAVLFFQVDDLAATIAAVGRELFIQVEPAWAVLHDPEGHNVLLLQKARAR